MTEQFRTIQETKGYNDFGQKYSDQIYNVSLPTSTTTTLEVPGGGVMGNITSQGSTDSKNFVLAVVRVSINDEVWVAVNKTAVAPDWNTFRLATSEIVTSDNPRAIRVAVGDIMSFSSPGSATQLSVSFYALPS
jgi:hypothetical protein